MGVFGGLAPPRLTEGEALKERHSAFLCPVKLQQTINKPTWRCALPRAPAGEVHTCSVLYRQPQEALSRRGGQQTLAYATGMAVGCQLWSPHTHTEQARRPPELLAREAQGSAERRRKQLP